MSEPPTGQRGPSEDPDPTQGGRVSSGSSSGSFFRQFAAVGPEERRFCLVAGLFFALLLGSYYMMRPLRDAYGAEQPERIKYLFLGTLVLTLVVQPLFGMLCRKYGRRRILPASYRVLALTTVAFGVALGSFEGETLRYTQYAFFCWVATYPLIGVSLFWGLLGDLLGPVQSLRLFGFVAVGGTLGAIVGAFIAGYAQGLLSMLGVGPEALAALAAVGLEACVWLTPNVERRAAVLKGDEESAVDEDDGESIEGGILSGFSRVVRSPYLLGLAAYVVIYVYGSTLLYHLGAEITLDAFESTETRAAFFAKIDLAVNVLTLLLQLFAVRWMIEKVGVGAALAAVPAITAIGLTALALEPTLLALGILQVLRRASEYGLSKPARDALFTVLSKEDKYKSKLVVDTVAYRGGDAAALWSKHGLEEKLGVGGGAMAWALVALTLTGAVLSFALGRSFRRRSDPMSS